MREVFFLLFLLNNTGFMHETSHIKPSKYDSAFGTKISLWLKKIMGWGCGSEQAHLTSEEIKMCDRLCFTL